MVGKKKRLVHISKAGHVKNASKTSQTFCLLLHSFFDSLKVKNIKIIFVITEFRAAIHILKAVSYHEKDGFVHCEKNT